MPRKERVKIDVGRLKELAMLTLTPEEEAEVKRRLTKILEYFDELRRLRLEGVDPMYTVELREPYYRGDDVRERGSGDALKVVPRTKERYVKAPRMS